MPKKIIIRKSPTPQPQQYRASPSPYAPRQKKDDTGRLCFWLGVLFGPVGLLLAAIVGKAAGLVKAMQGFVLVEIPLMVLTWWILAVVVPKQQRRARMREYLSYQSEKYPDLILPAGRPVRGK